MGIWWSILSKIPQDIWPPSIKDLRVCQTTNNRMMNVSILTGFCVCVISVTKNVLFITHPLRRNEKEFGIDEMRRDEMGQVPLFQYPYVFCEIRNKLEWMKYEMFWSFDDLRCNLLFGYKNKKSVRRLTVIFQFKKRFISSFSDR